MRRKEDARGGQLNGFLDEGSKVGGELRFRETFRVDGEVEGSVVSEGELLVGETGIVNGEIQVGSLLISGTVKGHVRATRRIEITPTGRVVAEIETPALVIEEGAFFQGRCTMQPKGQPGVAGAAPVEIEARAAMAERQRRG